ncbi:phosphatidylinositol phosphate synthase [Streptomonospora litoralis]|uniref:Phosphatidylinositol phosphate synthase n=1 Tax=Streptomonospora litoralis TaxID=2498135 RepID=A0A4P6Q3I5_9ACTN|nr:CDP-alcohol phosphatidyltransferase family protein [Streptomonospora litoralis]QBI55123.1 CDP-diacylglycerol--inositol 3-phosphatidyltransferase [Streptomonospora litoralis]
MLRYLRPLFGRLLLPLGRLLARLGVTPTMVTLTGALGVVASALVFYPRGELFTGSVAVTVFVLLDMLDGAVARASGSTTKWGAFLDSTLDRLSDAAILSGLVLWSFGGGENPALGYLTLFCLVSGFGVSYIKARAEGLGANCDVGIAERSERLVIVLVAVGLGGLGVPYILPAGLGVLALISGITIVQRLIETRNRLTSPRRTADDSGAV